MHQASTAQKTLAADCRKRRVVLSILPHFLSPWRPSRRFAALLLWCPRPKASHTAGGYRQQHFCGKVHKAMV